jgi:excisionase family DNA binding protein
MHSLLTAFAARQQLLKGALSAAEVASLLGTSRQTPLDRLRAGSLLGLRDGGIWRFPPWQFDPNGPDGVVAGLPAVLAALHASPFAKARWLMRAHPQLEGRSPIEALRAGEQARVVPLAARVQAQ